ncbi:MAG: hypothetical protein J6I65_04690 [Lachnospiraceae bacterium]|nr:hypothetical protein [Lachnospiraceae bacterium]
MSSNPNQCKVCHAKLSTDEKAIYLKLVSRSAKEFLCLDCLGEKLGCGRQPLLDKIKYYRESGNCVLFR